MDEYIPFEYSEIDESPLIYSLLSSLEYLSNIGNHRTSYSPQIVSHANLFIEDFQEKFKYENYEVKKALVESYIGYIDAAAYELEHLFNDVKFFFEENLYLHENQNLLYWNILNKHGIDAIDESTELSLGYPLHKDKKRGNLPSSAKRILKSWLETHSDNPYPTEKEKEELIERTGITSGQLCNWFINARRRLLPKLLQQKNKKRADKCNNSDEEFKLSNSKKRKKKGKLSDDEYIYLGG